MPVNTAVLTSGLTNAFTSGFDNTSEAAQAWADSFTGFILLVFPATTTAALAGSSLKASLTSTFEAVDISGNPTYDNIGEFISAITSDFEDWANIIGAGMTGTHESIVAPKATALSTTLRAAFDANLELTDKDSAPAIAATNIASVFQPWIITGTAVLKVTPFTPTTWL